MDWVQCCSKLGTRWRSEFIYVVTNHDCSQDIWDFLASAELSRALYSMHVCYYMSTV